MDILVRGKAVEKQENTTNNQTDSGCETSTTKSTEEILTTTTTTIISSDISGELVLIREPEINKRIVNRTAYAKLHRSLSPTRQLDTIKAKYDTEVGSKLQRKSAIKFNKKEPDSKLPIPKPRAAVKSEIVFPTQKVIENSKYRHSLILDKKSKKKDENSNEVFRKNSSSSGEFITIVTRSESIETIDKLEKELNLFTMDKKPKEKKRTSSFRKIFTGKIFSKEKKKKEEDTEQQIRKSINKDNIQNENFSRHSVGDNTKSTRIPQTAKRVLPPINMEEIEKKYAQMHVNEFNNIKHNFENPESTAKLDRPLQTVNPGPMDYKKMANINKFIDTSTSSAASTMESDRENSIKDVENSYKSLRFADNQRNTPPRAQELRQIQDVRLVNPKALIPINSERPLPNPYQNTVSNKSKQTHFNYSEQPTLDETYGTVLDSLDSKKEKIVLKPPRSPSLEPTKLRLPPNRDLGPMSPRMKSPIPQHHVSAEKLIATELLRSSRSPTPTKKRPNQLNLNQQISLDNESRVLAGKPPISRLPEHVSRMTPLSQTFFNHNRSTEYVNVPNRQQRHSQISPISSSQEKMYRSRTPDHFNIQISPKTNANSHERLVNSTMRSATPNILFHNPELSTARPQSSRSSTPVDLRINQSNKQSPQKEEMRKSVEAYYWKEIKKLKELENRDLYYYQVQYMPFGYAEEPISIRRSRSSSPSQRNGRRSLSLPREPKQVQITTEVDGYGRYQPIPIPEGRAVVNYSNYYNQNFKRNTPERRTIDVVGNNSINRPIFKRGSLTAPTREVVEDPQYKKVSFDAWPSRNGYTQYPPQRPQRHESLEDDVFLPQTTKLIVDGKEIYGYANRPYENKVMRKLESPQYQNANFYRQIQDPDLPTYGQHQRVSRRMSFDSAPQPQRRQIYVKDDVYGYFGDYIPEDQQNVVYSSRQNVNESMYGYYGRGVNKQITVRDKVCDIYGQIHDKNLKKSGVILGQVQNPSYTQIPNQNFVRNSRLTASANDMYKRYQHVDPRYATNNNSVIYYDAAPSRPLPPVPIEKKVYLRKNIDNVPELSVGENRKRAGFGNLFQSSPRKYKEKHRVDEDTHSRLILLEQLHLTRRQIQLEYQKREKQTKNSNEDEYRCNRLETKSTENLSMSDLEKLVHIEELQLTQLKISLELNDIK